MVAGAQLRPAAVLAMPFVVLLALCSAFVSGSAGGLSRSTLTDLPRLSHIATLTALLVSMLGEHLRRLAAGHHARTMVRRGGRHDRLLASAPALREARNVRCLAGDGLGAGAAERD